MMTHKLESQYDVVKNKKSVKIRDKYLGVIDVPSRKATPKPKLAHINWMTELKSTFWLEFQQIDLAQCGAYMSYHLFIYIYKLHRFSMNIELVGRCSYVSIKNACVGSNV